MKGTKRPLARKQMKKIKIKRQVFDRKVKKLERNTKSKKQKTKNQTANAIDKQPRHLGAEQNRAEQSMWLVACRTIVGGCQIDRWRYKLIQMISGSI